MHLTLFFRHHINERITWKISCRCALETRCTCCIIRINFTGARTFNTVRLTWIRNRAILWQYWVWSAETSLMLIQCFCCYRRHHHQHSHIVWPKARERNGKEKKQTVTMWPEKTTRECPSESIFAIWKIWNNETMRHISDHFKISQQIICFCYVWFNFEISQLGKVALCFNDELRKCKMIFTFSKVKTWKIK